MTIKEMANEIQKYCRNSDCGRCRIRTECNSCIGYFENSPIDCFNAYFKITCGKQDTSVITNENVSHPQHYCREGAMECIDEMILLFGRCAVMDFCLCNAWKYRSRAMLKNGEEDLKKSDWYISKYAELAKGDKAP